MSYDQASISQQLTTIRDYIRWTLSEFHRKEVYFGHGTDNPWDEAVQLVLAAVDLPWNSDPSILDSSLLSEERLRVIEFVTRRAINREPLPYITGVAWFAGLPFTVDDRVLIPRSPFAELIERHFSPWLPEKPVERILDLCTGSGCIGIACAVAFEEAEVDLADISTDALMVAEINIKRHELQDRVHLRHSDLFNQLEGSCYDLIVSNPPYVDKADLLSMPSEYQHEPELALGSGEDGLEITRTILRQAADFLTDEGVLLVEVGNSEVHLMEAYPQIPFTWVVLEEGGNGIFMLTAEVLKRYREII